MYKVIIGAAFGVLMTALVLQAPPPAAAHERDATADELQERLMQDQLDATQPDTDSPGWKQLNEEVGLMLQANRQGVLVARLFVRQRAGSWRPIPVEGPRDLGPSTLPAQVP